MGKLAITGGEAVHTTGWPSWPPQDPGYLEKLKAVLDSGVWGVGGPMNAALSEEFKRLSDAEYVVPNTSGTIALELALRALEVGAGDEVIVPPYTFIATASAVIAVNAIPIFADIKPDTLCLDADAVAAAVTPQTKAVIGVHIGGMPADLQALQAVCDRHGLALIEDCAQAHGPSTAAARSAPSATPAPSPSSPPRTSPPARVASPPPTTGRCMARPGRT